MATASQVVEQKVLEDDIKDVKQKIHVLEQKINVLEDGIKAFQLPLEHETADAARMQLLEQLTALQQQLAGLQQRLAALEQQKVLRMQQQAGGAAGDKRLEMLELLGLWPPPRWLQHSATSTKRPYNLVELAGKAE